MGYIYMVIGVAFAANAIVCGPHAFQFGRSAVVAMVAAGGALLVSGVWMVWKSKRDVPRSPED